MISIIIPVFNCEEFLYVCLNSVLKQTFSNFEVICIDDCSTDSSLEILEYFSRKDSRIKLLKNSRNRGPGYCRNQGLNNALGKYIFFLDADDWINPDALELLYSKSEKLNLDALIFKAIVFHNNEKKFNYEMYYNMDNFHIFEHEIFNPSQSESLFLNNLAASPWIKLYNKSFLDDYNIRFTNENLIQEDEAFYLDILLHAKRISFLNCYLYNRRRRDNSIMSLSGERLLDNVQIANIMVKSCLDNRKIYECHKKEILSYIFNIINSKYDKINEEYKTIFFESTKKLFDKCLNEYRIKKDIFENVNKDILIKFEIMDKNSSLNNKSNHELEKYLAIDIGGTAIKYIVTDSNLKILELNEIVSKTKSEVELYNSLDKIILPNLNQINGIALSFPGLINVKEGIAHTGGSFHWIQDLPLKSILEKRYSKTVWIENDGNCIALAELWKGNLCNVQNAVIMGLGTGISGGIIINGELYRGMTGAAGEFSSILDNFINPSNAHKLSQIGAYKGLMDIYFKLKGITSEYINGHEFFDRYYDGDEIAIRALKDYARIISTAIIDIQSILNVEKFCIGGGISSQDVLITEIKRITGDYFKNNASKAIKEPKIEKCFFENSAGCVGALYNFLIRENNIL